MGLEMSADDAEVWFRPKFFVSMASLSSAIPKSSAIWFLIQKKTP